MTTQTPVADNAVEVIPANIADHHANVVRLAESYHYQGELTVGALEDGIRFYQNRTAEACFEMGKRLLLLKEMCPHGEFIQRLELLGFQLRTAQRFMQVVLKLSNANTLSLLKVVESQSKMLELIALDDDQLEALNNGDSVGNIVLDDIEKMSVRELKKEIKKLRAENSAKDEVLATKNRKIDELDAKLSVRKQIDNAQIVKQEVETHINDELSVATNTLMTAVSQFNAVIDTLSEQATENELPHIAQKIEQEVSFLYNRLAEVGLAVGVDLGAMMSLDWTAPTGEQ